MGCQNIKRKKKDEKSIFLFSSADRNEAKEKERYELGAGYYVNKCIAEKNMMQKKKTREHIQHIAMTYRDYTKNEKIKDKKIICTRSYIKSSNFHYEI